MKKALIAIITLGLLSAGAVAFAGWGGPGYGPGACGGPGYGGAYGPGSCGGPGYGPGWGGGPATDVNPEKARKFFEETADIRKALHEKMFDYREAYRAGDEKKAEALEKDITELREKLYEMAKDAGISAGWESGPRSGYGPGARGGWGGGYGPGNCGGPGYGPGWSR